MFEMELKAHIQNKEKIISTISDFATFLQTCKKKDTYWLLKREDKAIRVRIREKTITGSQKKTIITYKKKNRIIDKKGKAFEVNEESECIIDHKETFEKILIDSGYKIELSKEKDTQQFKYENALIEICSITGLGDFLEIEIISDSNEQKIVDAIHKKLLLILELSGLKESDIENRYYSDMLKNKEI